MKNILQRSLISITNLAYAASNDKAGDKSDRDQAKEKILARIRANTEKIRNTDAFRAAMVGLQT